MIQNAPFPKPDANAVKIEIINPMVSPVSPQVPNGNFQVLPQSQYYYGYPQMSIYKPGNPPVIMSNPIIITKPVFISSSPKTGNNDKSSHIRSNENAVINGEIHNVSVDKNDVIKKTPKEVVFSEVIVPEPNVEKDLNAEAKNVSVDSSKKALGEGLQTVYVSNISDVDKTPVSEYKGATVVESSSEKASDFAKNVIIVNKNVNSAPVSEESSNINVLEENLSDDKKNKSEPVIEKTVTTITTETVKEQKINNNVDKESSKISENTNLVDAKRNSANVVVINNNNDVVSKKVDVEIVPPETVKPQIDIDSFCKRLEMGNFEEQFEVMKEIKDLVQKYPPDTIGTALVDSKIFSKLDAILHVDSSNLTGPSKSQVNARVKLMSGKPISSEEKTLAESLSPKEYAEHNKSIAMFTMASLNKLLIDILKNEDHIDVPLVDVPYANTIADMIKENPNPIVRASAIESLSWFQQPEYKDDLRTIFQIAVNDKNPNVSQTAKKALDSLNNIDDK